jgi:hypothetical protein
MISIFSKRFIQDVFYVEKYSVNLLSISKLFKDLNYKVIFKKENVIFRIYSSRRKLVKKMISIFLM